MSPSQSFFYPFNYFFVYNLCKSKTVPSSKGRLNLLHMDLCGLMRVASINGKKYILVIVDDYSRYTWTLFLRSKDETPEVLKDFLTMIQRNLQALVISVRTDRGTEFLNKTLNAFFKEEGIEHQTSTPRTPKQNGIASDYDNSDPVPQLQNVSPSADTTAPSQQELDLLFGPLYDEFFNTGTSRVNKSSSPTDNSTQQDTLPSTNIHPTSEPSTPTNIYAKENNDDQAEFTNPFCTLVLPPKTEEEILARERERKARTTLLIALPEDHLAKFHKMTDAKEMWEAIKSRFGGNDESKKMQKYILKQQFEGFSVSNSEGLHKGYDRSLPAAWSQISLIMRTKPGVNSLSFDDLYNNPRVFEPDVKGSTASSSSTQNVAFVSENASSTNCES
ncbi:retrovirus-related pol polyprotein from transposon TNT 1-94 [Tanacetum coccineum]